MWKTIPKKFLSQKIMIFTEFSLTLSGFFYTINMLFSEKNIRLKGGGYP